MKNIVKIMLKELKEPIEKKILWFGIFGCLLQIITFIISGNSVLSVVSGLLGVIAVILTSSRKMIAYIPAFLQLGTYVILAWQQRFYGELGENLFYFITMIFGFFIWGNNYKDSKVESKTLGDKNLPVALFNAIGIIVLCLILRRTNDTQPIMDSITTIPAFIAQILMILRYREQWVYWFIIDVASIVMWWRAGDYCMVAQFVFWTANCLLGWRLWDTKTKE